MYRIYPAMGRNLPDAADFIDTLETLQRACALETQPLFDPEPEIVVSRAPGRLDVMGGIADYSGSLVLQLPILEATYVALQPDLSRRLRIVSLSGDATPALTFEMPLSE